MATVIKAGKLAPAQAVLQVERVTPLTYAGLFVITLANLMYENLLTRIFSVTMFYNFAFMAVSIALFGMTVGSIMVYLGKERFRVDNVKENLATYSLIFAVTILISFFIHTQIPFQAYTTTGTLFLALNYVVIAIPFVFGGVVVSLALTKIPGSVSKLYAADLIGAALGCVVFVVMLKVISGPSSVVLISLLACLGAVLFAFDTNHQRLRVAGLSTGAALVVLLIIQVALSGQPNAPLRLKWIKGFVENDLLYEKWNSYSRVRVTGTIDQEMVPFGWGLSSTLSRTDTFPQLYMDIDSTAATVLTKYNGDPDQLGFLKYDVTNMVHYIRPDSSVLVIGIGGGRDILSALAFKQPAVTGVEINENIIDILNNKFGDYTGHLDQQPGVRFVNDEARSYVARSKDQYDIIQVSLIDTFAATAAGAYVFSENSLYTTEGWKIWFDHLSPDGVISYSRWYFPDYPAEMYRLTALASQTLIEAGIENPRDHMIIISSQPDAGQVAAGQNWQDGVATLLVSKTAFTQQDIDTLRQVSKEMKFDVLLSNQDAMDPAFVQLTTREGFNDYINKFTLDISPPDDNRPFFFHTLRIQNIFDKNLWSQGNVTFNLVAVYTLGVLLLTVILLTFLCIFIPLLLTTRQLNTRRLPPFLLYFIGIGFGFMLVEISQMQRLTVFLGHPTYSLATALFSLLLFSGIGSYLTEKVGLNNLRQAGAIRLGLLLVTLLVFGLITPPIIRTFSSSPNIVRILLSAAILSPLGLFMGMAFPLGMKSASGEQGDILPWLWGINGATSVCASVIAIVIAMTFSISTSYWTGFASYGVAALAFGWVTAKKK